MTPDEDRAPTPAPPLDWRAMAIRVIVVVAAVFAGYIGIVHNPLLSDDLNMRVLFDADGTPDMNRLRAEWTSGWGGLQGADYYRPLLTYSVMHDWFWWGTNPFGYHLTNLLLHALNALLVGLIITRIAGPGKRYPGTLASIVFALHPAHPEAVAWIAGRVDLLSAFFYLLTIRAYLAYRWSGRRRHLGIALAAMAAGLTSKESVITVPAVLLTLDVCLKMSRGLPRWAFGARPAGLLFVALAGAYLLFRRAILGSLSGSQDLLQSLASGDAFLEALRQTAIKLFALLAPVNTEATSSPWPTVFQIVVVVALLLPFLELLTHGRRAIPGPITGLALILAPLALVAHIHVDLDTLTNSRVLYLPVAGFLIVLYSGPWAPRVRPELRRLGAAQVAVLSMTMAICYFVALRVNLRPWIIAGGTMRAVVRDIDRVERTTPPGTTVVAVSVPDHIHGAYVCRNGFLFALVRPFHHRDIRRVFPVLDYFWHRDPGLLRALRNGPTRIVFWDGARGRFADLPPDPTADGTPSAGDLRRWADLGGEQWRAVDGLERIVHDDGRIELRATRPGAALVGPVMAVSPDAVHALAFDQSGDGGLSVAWSNVLKPDTFPSDPVVSLPPHTGRRTLALINHAQWYLPPIVPVARLRIAPWPVGASVTLDRVAFRRRLESPSISVFTEPIVAEPGRSLAIPVEASGHTQWKVVILNPGAPETIHVTRAANDGTPLEIPAARVAHLHRLAEAIGPYDALLWADALPPGADPILTAARTRIVRVRFGPLDDAE